jgi:hypothetical protein
VNDTSNVENAEFNYVHTWTHWSFIAGFRYFHLDDQFDLRYDGSFPHGGTQTFNFATANDLYGGQIGFNYHHEWRRLFVDLGTKWGIYGNVAVQHGTESEDGFIEDRLSNYPKSSAVSGEFDFSLGHRFSPHWTAQLGLMVVEFDNLTLAPDIDVSNSASANITLVGLSFGETAQW